MARFVGTVVGLAIGLVASAKADINVTSDKMALWKSGHTLSAAKRATSASGLRVIFRPVRRMSCFPLIAAQNRTSPDVAEGPKAVMVGGLTERGM